MNSRITWKSVSIPIVLLYLTLQVGCKMTAPIHVWKLPTLASGGSVRVAVAPIGGDHEVAERLQQALASTQPQSNPQLTVLHPDQLERLGGIQLAAYDGQPSEMAALGAARRTGAQYLLAGHVVSHELWFPDELKAKRPWYAIFSPPPPTESMTVRWAVYDVASGRRLGDSTIAMDPKEAERNYPDLAFQAAGDAKVIAASARRSWEMVIPTTYAEDVSLDLPWFSPGSSKVRQGNGYARMGRWELAEFEWQEAADQHNWNTAAWRNLCIAAVAKEDFELARSRLKHADTMLWPGDETRKTLQWVEQRQREYNAAFQLPPPEGGWTYSDPSTSRPTQETQAAVASKPKSLDEQPWYTALPFIPPPGWTWSQWWSQPWVW